jgi:hypothetical protein
MINKASDKSKSTTTPVYIAGSSDILVLLLMSIENSGFSALPIWISQLTIGWPHAAPQFFAKYCSQVNTYSIFATGFERLRVSYHELVKF